MKKFLYILFLSASLLTSGAFHASGQNLPMACVGSNESYWVKGFNGHSDFTWRILDPSNNVVPATFYTLVGRGDTIRVHWDESLIGGIYTFEVIESPDDLGCGTATPYTQEIVLNSPTINIPFEGVPTSVVVCYPNLAELNPGLFSSYLWQDGSTNRIYYTGESGTYRVKLTDISQSCSYNEIEATINPLPTVWLGNDTMLVGDQSLLLDAFNPTVLTYQWNTNDNQSSLTVYSKPEPQTIWVKVTDDNGCTNADTILISTADFNNLRIPAAFTPNGDGINDKWYFPAPPKGTQQDLFPYFDEVQVRVFNRWGRLVWQTDQDFVAWDGRDLSGKVLPMDSYHYIIKFTIDGKTFVYKGSITIVR
ncbi:MAG: gliding motility-associated C-terminal domain-containing protein [Bacteroidales bacterium]|nr:MAG: gliding motility-associated C-terminal domain-containing protein [Bacteroidales bacterium]